MFYKHITIADHHNSQQQIAESQLTYDLLCGVKEKIPENFNFNSEHLVDQSWDSIFKTYENHEEYKKFYIVYITNEAGDSIEKWIGDYNDCVKHIKETFELEFEQYPIKTKKELKKLSTIADVMIPLTESDSVPKFVQEDIPEENIKQIPVTIPVTTQPKMSSLKETIHIEVMSASDLMSMDRGGKSDPYVILIYGQEQFKTTIIKKNLNPVWDNEHFSFILSESDKFIKVEMWDWNRIGAPDFMGQFLIDSKTLTNEWEEQDFTLKPLTGTSIEVKGTLKLRLKRV